MWGNMFSYHFMEFNVRLMEVVTTGILYMTPNGNTIRLYFPNSKNSPDAVSAGM